MSVTVTKSHSGVWSGGQYMVPAFKVSFLIPSQVLSPVVVSVFVWLGFENLFRTDFFETCSSEWF